MLLMLRQSIALVLPHYFAARYSCILGILIAMLVSSFTRDHLRAESRVSGSSSSGARETYSNSQHQIPPTQRYVPPPSRSWLENIVPCADRINACYLNNVVVVGGMSAFEQAYGSTGPKGCAASMAFNIAFLAFLESFNDADQLTAASCTSQALEIFGIDVSEETLEKLPTDILSNLATLVFGEGFEENLKNMSTTDLEEILAMLPEDVLKKLRGELLDVHNTGASTSIHATDLNALQDSLKDAMRSLLTQITKFEYVQNSLEVQDYFNRNKGCYYWLDILMELSCAAISCLPASHPLSAATKAACVAGATTRGLIDCTTYALECYSQQVMAQPIARTEPNHCPFLYFDNLFVRSDLCHNHNSSSGLIPCADLHRVCQAYVQGNPEIKGNRHCVKACLEYASELAYGWCPQQYEIQKSTFADDGEKDKLLKITAANFAQKGKSYQHWVQVITKFNTDYTIDLYTPTNGYSDSLSHLLCSQESRR